MKYLYENLIEEEHKLKELIDLLTDSMKTAPKGKLKIAHKGKSTQYYYKSDECADKNKDIDKTNGPLEYMKNSKTDHYTYIKKENLQFAKSLAQRDYDTELCKIAKKRLRCVQATLKHYQENEMEQLYDKLHPYRKELVEPRIITDQAYAKAWEQVEYTGKSFEEGTAVIYSNRGERVRSKSEKIIADMLQKEGVPYRYESPIMLRGIGTVHPDFTILNVKERKEIYWEHLGMMDNQNYCEKALRKIEAYQKNGIILGDRLILSYETSKYPLETSMIERNIRIICQ